MGKLNIHSMPDDTVFMLALYAFMLLLHDKNESFVKSELWVTNYTNKHEAKQICVKYISS